MSLPQPAKDLEKEEKSLRKGLRDLLEHHLEEQTA
jgi:hypothetical protein